MYEQKKIVYVQQLMRNDRNMIFFIYFKSDVYIFLCGRDERDERGRGANVRVGR